jgi:thiol-disulfide isomerase/thioredoxin
LPIVASPASSNGHGLSKPGLLLGDPAPEFSLPDLSGKFVSLSHFRGQATLLLFWNPGCGFCQRMLPKLKAWETQAREGTPALLVISSGGIKENRAMGLRAPVLLDKSGMSIGSQFAVHGTPMAVLVDAQGAIASEVATGEKAVLALAGATAAA